MLVADQVHAAHPGGPPVLRGACLAVAAGGRMAVLGANGSGKTTLLRCLSGAHRPSAGSVAWDGTTLEHTRGALRAHRRRVQLVLQDPDDQLFSADVSQDVAFGPLNLGLDENAVRVRVTEALEVMGIAGLAGRATHQLSYGERKRVTIAGAVAMRPQVLLLDEPTAGLDPMAVEETRAALARLSDQGTTIVLATHDVDFALSWADEAAVVSDGVVRQGPVVDMLADTDALRRARLRPPMLLELAAALGLPQRPRTLADVVRLVSAQANAPVSAPQWLP